MSLTSVKMSEEVWLTCQTHALSTETEEIMGLLLGDVQPSKNGGLEALIWGASPQLRCDRRKDRVETDPEQLAAASAQADKMTAATGRTTRVIGWYHSHPHITVLPSQVDLRTQAMYQQLESGFIGLIFSCFNEDANKVGRIQVVAFQSLNGKQRQMLRAVPVSPVKQTAIVDLDLSVSTSKDASSQFDISRYISLEQDTADSKTIVVFPKVSEESSDVGGVSADADAKNKRKKKRRGKYSDDMQEALLRSNLEVSEAEFTRKEIPLHVLPALSFLKLDSPLASFVDLQRVLFEEEQAVYNQASLESSRNGKVHPLTFIHHKSTYEASLCKLMEFCLSPAITALQAELREKESRLSFLLSEYQELEQQENAGASVETNRDAREQEESKIVVYRRRTQQKTKNFNPPIDATDMKKIKHIAP